MPAHGNAANAEQTQASAIDLEAVSRLLQAKGVKAILPLEARVAGALSRLDAAEERLESLVEIGHDDLEDVAVNLGGEGVVDLVDLDATQLLHLADGPAFR